MDTLKTLTDEEFEAEYKLRQQRKIELQNEKRNAYLALKNELVSFSIAHALRLERELAYLHTNIMNELLSFKEVMNEYGDIPKNSKGGYSIEDENDQNRVRLKYRSLSDFDERATLAEGLLRSFFERTLKVTDQTAYDMLMKLLERKKGKLEASRAMEILSFEDRYNDEEWTKGCQLLKESYKVTGSKYYVEFEQKDDNGNWRSLALNFSSL